MTELLEALVFHIDENEDQLDLNGTYASDDSDTDSVEEDTRDFDVSLDNPRISLIDVVECCKSLVTHDATGLVRFSHETVKVYIGKNFKQDINLAKTCITYIALTVFEQPCSERDSLEARLTKYPLSRYVAQY